MESIQLRKATRRDIPFITSGWLKSFRNAPFVRGVPNTVYYYHHHKLLETLIPRSTVLVACNAEDTDQLVGFICYETFKEGVLIHYVYVKQTLRKVGIAKKMFETAVEGAPLIQYTAKTYPIFDMEERLKERGAVYNPYSLYTSLPEGWENEQ